MSLRYLVDTDWAIDHLKGRPEITQELKLRQPEGLGLSRAAYEQPAALRADRRVATAAAIGLPARRVN